MIKDNNLQVHPAGIYFQHVPIDPVTGLSAIPYDQTDEYDLTKIDMLHLSLLDHFSSREELLAVSRMEPDWDMFQDEGTVLKLFHLSRHYDLLKYIKPRSVQAVADCIALIRPGKKHLLHSYKTNPEKTRKLLYMKTDQMYFKKPHAIAYAKNVCIQLVLIQAGIVV